MFTGLGKDEDWLQDGAGAGAGAGGGSEFKVDESWFCKHWLQYLRAIGFEAFLIASGLGGGGLSSLGATFFLDIFLLACS